MSRHFAPSEADPLVVAGAVAGDPLVLRALRQTFRFLDGGCVLRLEYVSHGWSEEVSGADWWWRQQCVHEFPKDLIRSPDGVSWRRYYKSWQPTLRCIARHPYYKTLKLSSDPKFLRAFRRELLHSCQADFFAERKAQAEKRRAALAALAGWGLKVAERAEDIHKLETGSNSKGDTQRSKQLSQRAQQLQNLLACPGCSAAFGPQNLPNFLDTCGHAVCCRCLQRPQCPRCKVLTECATSRDRDVEQCSARLLALTCPVADGSGIRDFVAVVNSDVAERLVAELEKAKQIEKLHRDNLSSNDLVSRHVVRSYRQLALVHHPDHGGKRTSFQDINDAYNVLRVQSSRFKYNKMRHWTYVNNMRRESSEAAEKACANRRKPRHAMLTDPRPPMPSEPKLDLAPSAQPPFKGWRIVCSCRHARDAQTCSIQWRGPDAEEWTTLAEVPCEREPQARTNMVILGGQYEVRCIARNAHGQGPPSNAAPIYVPAAATEAELAAERREAAKKAKAAAEAAALRKGRTRQRAARRRLSRLEAAVQEALEVLESGAEGEGSEDLCTAALVELRRLLESAPPLLDVLGLASGVLSRAQELLAGRQQALAWFDALPPRARRGLLLRARGQRRSAALARALRGWWRGAALGDEGRRRLSTVQEEDLTAFLAENLKEHEMLGSSQAYALWRDAAAHGPDDLGLLFKGGEGGLGGRVTVAPSMLRDGGAGLWELLEASGMVGWSVSGQVAPTTTTTTSEAREADYLDSGGDESGTSSGSDSGPECGFDEDGNALMACEQARIQLLVLEAIASGIKEAAEAQCCEIRRLLTQASFSDHTEAAYSSCAEAEEEEYGCAAERSYCEDSAEEDPSEVSELKDIGSLGRCSRKPPVDEGTDRCGKGVEEASNKKKSTKKTKETASQASSQAQAQNAHAKKSKPPPARTAFQLFLAADAAGDLATVKAAWRELPADARRSFEGAAKEEKQRRSEDLEEWQKWKELPQNKLATSRQEKKRGAGR